MSVANFLYQLIAMVFVKKLEIIIPERTFPALSEVIKEANIGGYSCHEIQGKGSEAFLISKLKVEVVVTDERVEELINKIIQRIGGDIKTGGKIFVEDVVNAVDLVTKKKGEAAI